jgi:tol-pal system protein YbgF
MPAVCEALVYLMAGLLDGGVPMNQSVMTTLWAPVGLMIGLAAVLFLTAPPADGQSRELIQLQGDIVRLQHQVSEMQSGLDARNAAFQGLVEQIVDQLAALSGSVSRIDSALDEVQQSNSALSGEMRVLMSNLRDDVEIVNRNLGDVRNQMATLSSQVTNIGAAPSAGGFDSSQELMGIAEADFYAGNYPLAIEEFRDYLRTYPNGGEAPQAQLYIGNAYFQQAAYELAIIEYDKLLQTYPNSDRKVTALYQKGLAYMGLGRATEAVDALSRVVSEHPTSAEAISAQDRLRELR